MGSTQFCRSVRTPLTVVRTGRSGPDAHHITTAELALDAQEPVFDGHYPGFPIFAGVFLVESAHRAAAAAPPEGCGPLRLAAVESARFLSPAYPGDLLTVELTWTPKGDGWLVRGVLSGPRAAVARVRLRYAPAAAPVEPFPAVTAPASGTGDRMLVPDIVQRIPHRQQMLLIDQVLDFVPGEHVTAVKAVTYGEPWYRWQRPEPTAAEAYAYPIGLLMESLNQAAAMLATADAANTDVLASEVLMLGSYGHVSFGEPVYPGDLLEHTVRLTRTLNDTQFFEGSTRVRGKLVLTAGQMVLARRQATLIRPEMAPTP
ncbi:3-hydroxyacyl-ACP dehydratase FabZ family protein [Streptomyces sp. SAJ15]|uniref:3-hydroxyacyl-ACP dehydratase FabZ family protein n=1 Tax=Streptomyces sp. SAJ15 TaxID=2011095 RepID=UPI0021B2BA75|nr:hypothetical protein [Streptomyces sp. SAJ15]